MSEVDLMMRIEHPFIVNMLGCFQDNHTLYLCLEFVPGEVFTILREEGRFSMDTFDFTPRKPWHLSICTVITLSVT